MTTAMPDKPFKPRRSSIGQAAQTEAAAAAPTPDISPAPARPRPAAVAPEPQAPVRNKRIAGDSRDILFSLPDEEKARMVNTIAHTSARTGIKHQSRFLRYAIAQLCAQLEEKYNNGEPFEAPAEEPI